MFKLLVLIDDWNYVLNEPYQHQLWRTAKLRSDIECTFVTLDDITNKKEIEIKKFDNVYCALKVRNTRLYVKQIAEFLQGTNVIIQDYDPWCNFIDDQPHKGCYDDIIANLNVQRFFVSSRWWANFMINRGIKKVTPIKLGVLDYYVDANSHAKRRGTVEFRGSKHELRVRGFDKLFEAGVEVEWKLSISPYISFLNDCSNISIWCHNEGETVPVDGVPYIANSLWPKAIEVLARGLFLVRDFQDESLNYEIDKMPTAMLFNGVEEAKGIIDNIKSMSVEQKDELMIETTQFIKHQYYYDKIIDEITWTS